MLKQRLLTSVFIAAAMIPLAAHAQDAYNSTTPVTNLGKLTATSTGAGIAAANTPGSGLLVNENSTKQVSTVTRAYMQTQAPSSNPFQLLNLEPSVNTQSIDGFGGVGGSLEVRGFQSSEIGFTIEGVPVNDSGNYAVYPQEYVDNENLDNIFLSQGSVDLNAPHIGASGGNIGISMIDPSDTPGGYIAQGIGNDSYHRTFLRLESGDLPTGTKFYVSGSFTDNDKWRGAGNDKKYNIEAKLIQQLPHDSSLTASFIYVWELNDSYRALSKSQWQANENLDYDTTFGGYTDTNYYALHVNPFKNIITQITGSFGITDNLRLTIQPYFWYGFGNGGGASDESVNGPNYNYNSSPYIIPFAYPLPTAGDASGGGKVLAYGPSITNTFRTGVINTLTYNIANQTIAGGYWYEVTRHQQLGTETPVGPDGVPGNVWGTEGYYTEANGAAGEYRRWLTQNIAQEFFLTDDATWLNDALNTYVGLRTPNYNRKTTNEDNGIPTADMHLRRDYNDILPYVGVSYNFNPAAMVFTDFAGTFRAPQNYAFFDVPQQVYQQKPEEAFTTEVGYRYQTDTLLFQSDAYTTHFTNRQGSLGVDPVDNTPTDRNMGATQDYGVELAAGYEPAPGFSLHANGSFNRSEILDNQPVLVNGAVDYLPTKGKQFPDTPRFQWSAGTDYAITPQFTVGANVKWEDVRYSTYMNDESAAPNWYAEFHADYHLGDLGIAKDPVLQLNIVNPFSFNQLGEIYSQTLNGQNYQFANGTQKASSPTYMPTAPASITVTLSSAF